MSPFVTIVIPTFNAEKYLQRVLQSILDQDYPEDKCEVIVVDDGSTDSTIAIAKRAGVKILHSGQKNAEISKAVGLRQARGELIYFGDSDVILAAPSWISRLVEPFRKEKDIFASECKWGIASDFTSVNTYCALLQIADPLARMLSNRTPDSLNKSRDYDVYTFGKANNPVLYCVMWRVDLLREIVGDQKTFTEGYAPAQLIHAGHNKVAHVKNTVAYHYYSDSLSDYLNKRRKIARKFLKRRQRSETWVEKRSKAYFLFCVLYLATFVAPLIEALVNTLRSRRIEWLWHPVVGFLTIWTYVKSFLPHA
jgi:glycosyltransferase involved in cell wall biosynthesis